MCGRNLVRVRDIVVAAIFDFMTVEERSRASKGVFLIFTVFLISGRRFLFSLPAPSPLPLTRPISSSPREVSTWRFQEQIARYKKTPALRARSWENEKSVVYYMQMILSCFPNQNMVCRDALIS